MFDQRPEPVFARTEREFRELAVGDVLKRAEQPLAGLLARFSLPLGTHPD